MFKIFPKLSQIKQAIKTKKFKQISLLTATLGSGIYIGKSYTNTPNST